MTETESWIQQRFKWNEILITKAFLPDIAEAVGVGREDLIFIGGIACYFLLTGAFGERVTQNWRGTGDIDLVIFGIGSAKRTMDAIREDKKYVKKAEVCESHLPDKYCCRIIPTGVEGNLSRTDPKDWIQVDIYGQKENGGVTLNQRTLTSSEKILNYPPEEITINKKKFRFAGLYDMITLKFDVLTGALDLRLKDLYDLLGCFAVAERRDIPPSGLYNHIERGILGKEYRDRARKAIGSLAEEFDHHNCPFKPSRDYFKEFLSVYRESHTL